MSTVLVAPSRRLGHLRRNVFGGFVEHLGKISAALFLNQDCSADNSQVLNRHAMEQILNGAFQFKAKVLLFKTCSEFSAQRIRALARDHAHGGNEALSGSQGADHQVAGLWQFLFKSTESRTALEEHKAYGRE